MSGKDDAARTARWRERTKRCGKGDHKLCTPRSKCPVVGTARPGAAPAEPAVTAGVTGAGDVTGDVTLPPEDRVTQLPPPAGLGDRGSRLWAAESGNARDVGHLILLEEACRTADTLERLNTMVHANEAEWLEIVRNDAESTDEVAEVRVVVNGLLVEQRQQQDTFRRQVAELRLAGRGATASSGQQAGQTSPNPAGTGAPERSAGDASAAPDAPHAGKVSGGIGDLINAAGRFQAQG